MKTMRNHMLVCAVALIVSVATTAVVQEASVGPVAAGNGDCVVGILSSGAGFIALAAAPPPGVWLVLGWGAALATFGVSVRGCNNNGSLINAIKQWRANHACGYNTTFLGYHFNWYTGQYDYGRWTGGGGGGGCSGSW